jgi:adenylylsulfate kinase
LNGLGSNPCLLAACVWANFERERLDTMNSSTDLVTVTTIAAVLGGPPRIGQEYVIAASGRRSPARLAAISPLRPDLSQTGSSERKHHWSQLAALQVEGTGKALGYLCHGKVHQFELLDKTSEVPVAAGLAIGHKSNDAFIGSSGMTIWLTGLSGAGKSTIAQELERRIRDYRKVECLDADVVRTHLCKGLGFTAEDRIENVRRLALTARIIAETGAIVVVSAISPYRAAREEARSQAGGFIEVYVNAPLSVCESRDVKGLYKRARMGEIKAFTGIDDPYEAPLAPEVECCTHVETLEESVTKILAAVAQVEESLAATGRPQHPATNDS